MSGSSPSKKNNISDAKFLFDRHNFDAPESEPEEEIPPPPTFTEEELAAEKQKSFEEGKQTGLDQAAASREQQIVQTLNVIAEQFSALFAAEQLRENLYERESVKLAKAMLETVLPELNQRFGNQEIFPVIENTLQNFSQKTSITITLPNDIQKDIESRLSEKWPDEETRPRFRITGSDSLQPGSCDMSWEDGGAVRHAHELIEKIRDELAHLVPDDPESESPTPEDQTGDSAEPENNAITRGKDSQAAPETPAEETGDDHE